MTDRQCKNTVTTALSNSALAVIPPASAEHLDTSRTRKPENGTETMVKKAKTSETDAVVSRRRLPTRTETCAKVCDWL